MKNRFNIFVKVILSLCSDDLIVIGLNLPDPDPRHYVLTKLLIKKSSIFKIFVFTNDIEILALYTKLYL